MSMQNQFYDISLEMQILSGIIDNPQDLEKYVSIKSEYFYHPFHKNLFETFKILDEKGYPLDEAFIKRYFVGGDEAFDNKQFTEVYVTPALPYTQQYIDLFVEFAEYRRFSNRLKNIQAQLREKVSLVKIKEELEALLLDRMQNKANDKTLAEWMTYCDSEPPMPIYDTGVSIIDQGLGGLEVGQLVLVGGDPEAGKTVLTVQIAKNIAKHNQTTFFPLEFTINHFIKRQIYIEKREWVQNQNNLHLITDIYNIAEIASKIKEKHKQGCNVFVIDSQMRVESDAGRTVEEEETRKFAVLAKLAHKLKILIMLIFQSAKTNDNSPMGSKKAAHESSVTFYLSFPPEHVKKHETDGIEYRFFEVRKNKQNGKRFKELVKLDTKKGIFSMLQKETQKFLLNPKSEPNGLVSTQPFEMPIIKV